jgi:hypothetical protein
LADIALALADHGAALAKVPSSAGRNAAVAHREEEAAYLAAEDLHLDPFPAVVGRVQGVITIPVDLVEDASSDWAALNGDADPESAVAAALEEIVHELGPCLESSKPGAVGWAAVLVDSGRAEGVSLETSEEDRAALAEEHSAAHSAEDLDLEKMGGEAGEAKLLVQRTAEHLYWREAEAVSLA